MAPLPYWKELNCGPPEKSNATLVKLFSGGRGIFVFAVESFTGFFNNESFSDVFASLVTESELAVAFCSEEIAGAMSGVFVWLSFTVAGISFSVFGFVFSF